MYWHRCITGRKTKSDTVAVIEIKIRRTYIKAMVKKRINSRDV